MAIDSDVSDDLWLSSDRTMCAYRGIDRTHPPLPTTPTYFGVQEGEDTMAVAAACKVTKWPQVGSHSVCVVWTVSWGRVRERMSRVYRVCRM